MDELATKALIVGVSIMVTLIIVTVVIFEFTEIKKVYKGTAEANITFESRLDEFDKYRDSSNIFTGLDVKNTIAKYVDDNLVDVCLQVQPDELVCSDIQISKEQYNKEYSCDFQTSSNKYTIIFTAK